MAKTTTKSTSPKAKTVAKKTAKKPLKKEKFDKATYIDWYENMLLMRKFEEKAGQLYIQQKFGGFCHLYIGQEAILVGMTKAIRKTDRVITAYRDHDHPLALGVHPKYVMAELYGKTTGLSKGKGGSMHMFSKEHNLFGGHGIVGGQIALGAGIAFADKYNDNDNVTVCFFGDGAARQGILHETFNMAMNWKLPVIFIVENNNYAMGTSVKRTSNVEDLSVLGEAYEMPSEIVEGMYPEPVCEAIERAAARARKGEGPTLLDIKTYRYKGHSMSDPQKYRTKEEVKAYQEKDPLIYVFNKIKKNKWLTDAQIKKIQEKVKNLITESVKFAEESPNPTPDELYKDVYTQEDYPFIKD